MLEPVELDEELSDRLDELPESSVDSAASELDIGFESDDVDTAPPLADTPDRLESALTVDAVDPSWDASVPAVAAVAIVPFAAAVFA